MRLTVSEINRAYYGQIVSRVNNADRELGRQRALELQVAAYPAVVLIDGNGQVVRRFFGIVPGDDIRAALDALLAEPG